MEVNKETSKLNSANRGCGALWAWCLIALHSKQGVDQEPRRQLRAVRSPRTPSR